MRRFFKKYGWLYSIPSWLVAILALLTPGPLMGTMAVPLALPAFIGGVCTGVLLMVVWLKGQGNEKKKLNA
ncbi:MAG: hypothetical protein ACPG7F_02680 [Aggregatilineales bacterium]